MATAQIGAVLSTAARSSRLSVDVPVMSPAYSKAASRQRHLLAGSRYLRVAAFRRPDLFEVSRRQANRFGVELTRRSCGCATCMAPVAQPFSLKAR